MKPVMLQSLLTGRSTSIVKFEPGKYVYSHGENCANFVLLKSGCIRVELLSSTGHQLLLYRIREGQSCVITTACLLGGNAYSAQAITETNSELVLLPKKEFEHLLHHSTEFRMQVFSGFSNRLSDVIQRTSELTTRSVDQRLAATLIAHAQQNNCAFNVTHEELAIEVGTAREVISRRLAAFEKQGVLTRDRGHISIGNIRALGEICR